VADRVFGLALWQEDSELFEVWKKSRFHILQEQEPYGDRKWLEHYPFLQNLTKFEQSIGCIFKKSMSFYIILISSHLGIEFTHIRLLARAFTDRSMGFTNLTLGSNQRLEFLGDTVLQLISSEYLYKHFPEHHEGHLSVRKNEKCIFRYIFLLN
jgi:ribonuclease III